MTELSPVIRKFYIHMTSQYVKPYVQKVLFIFILFRKMQPHGFIFSLFWNLQVRFTIYLSEPNVDYSMEVAKNLHILHTYFMSLRSTYRLFYMEILSLIPQLFYKQKIIITDEL